MCFLGVELRTSEEPVQSTSWEQLFFFFPARRKSKQQTERKILSNSLEHFFSSETPTTQRKSTALRAQPRTNKCGPQGSNLVNLASGSAAGRQPSWGRFLPAEHHEGRGEALLGARPRGTLSALSLLSAALGCAPVSWSSGRRAVTQPRSAPIAGTGGRALGI